MTDALSNTLTDRIETVEAGYEFLLAYAAQGRDDDRTPAGGSEVRDTLQGMSAAIEAIIAHLNGVQHDFAGVAVADARKTMAAISLVLAHDRIASELIDNLNASIHLRALLTDLFLIDDAGF